MRVPDSRRSLAGLVDSGADLSALPLAFAVRLKLDIDPIRSRRVAGIAGTVEALQAASDVELETEAGSVRLKRPALVRGLPFAVLGRPDFFAAYRVCFEQSAERMDIEPQRAPIRRFLTPC